VEPVPLAGEPLDDHLHVTPGAAGHLVTDELRLLREAGPADRAAKLAQFRPDLVALACPVALEPVR
jgi:hypothetical protein